MGYALEGDEPSYILEYLGLLYKFENSTSEKRNID